jgi:hypothetical protein
MVRENLRKVAVLGGIHEEVPPEDIEEDEEHGRTLTSLVGCPPKLRSPSG